MDSEEKQRTYWHLQLQLAEHTARTMHAGQLYGNQEYAFHLGAVESAVCGLYTEEEFSAEELSQLRCAAWLHDVIEDTEMSLDALREAGIDQAVIDLVDCVTAVQVHPETGDLLKNRRARHKFTYRKIASSRLAKALKLADRFANVENCVETGSKLLGMYRREHADFSRDAIGQVTGQLDDVLRQIDSMLYNE